MTKYVKVSVTIQYNIIRVVKPYRDSHLHMAVMHLPMKFGSDIFIQSGFIDIFRKLKMVAAVILNLGELWDHPRSLIRGAYVPPVKISS